jgi:cytochrome c-type biogenesis protein CcmF
VILGDVLVWVAVVLAVAAAVTAGRGPSRHLLLGAAAGLTVALARLAFGFATEEWALDYVADHTRSGLAAPIRIAGLWAGAEGSLLLWTVMVAWVVLVAVRGREASDAAEVWALRLGGGLVAGYGLLVALVASPFERSPLPAIGGLGLQPVLEYPAMIWHPPILYAGLVGLLVPMIRASARMLAGRPPMAASELDRQRGPVSMTLSMAVLTVGLATGALWAGVELGWGGYWAWDPIESAGLVAWLCGAAALHAAPAAAGPGPSAGALRVAPGVAAIWATTLTRVGLVASVHAFADRPTLRLGLLFVAAVATVAATASVVVWSRASLPADGATPAPTALADSRRVATVVLALAVLIVAVGAYEPLIEAATSGDAVAIAGEYYTRLLWPVTIVGAALAVRADRRWWWAVGGAAVGAVAVPVTVGPFALAVAAGGGASAGSAVGCWFTSRGGGYRRAGVVAHIGVGIALVGIAGTVASSATTVTVAVDETVVADGMAVTHWSVELVDGTSTSEAVAAVDVDGDRYHPRLVTYDLRGVSTSETATRMVGLDEVQVQLVDGNDRAARYRIVRIPRVGLVWLGAAIVAVGFAGQPLRRLRARSSDNVDCPSSPSSAAPSEPTEVPGPRASPDGGAG